jgi:3-oxoadipate enol-lactonase
MASLAYAPGAKLFYLDDNPAGDRAVLLLHGLGVTGRSWRFQIPVLVQAGFRVLAPDMPGFGRSTAWYGAPGMNRLVYPLVALLDHLKLTAVDVIGISMGGTIALQLTLDHPSRVNRLILISTFARLKLANPYLLPFYLMRYLQVETTGLERQVKGVALRMFPHPEQSLQRTTFTAQVLLADPAAYQSTMRLLARFNVQDRLSEICAPTLVVTPSRDTTVAPANQYRLAQGIPAARHVIIQDSGHAVIGEKPDEFNQIMLDFVGPDAKS